MKKFNLLLFLSVIALSLHAQENCTEKLYHANGLYEKGQIKEAIEIAKTCTGSENKTEQWQAYHLLAMAYLADNQSSEARKSTEKMMEINPTYKPGSKDPIEMSRLIKSVKVIPKFSMGLAATLGGNFTFPNVTATYNGAGYEKQYQGKTSWQMGMIIGYNMNEIISLHTGLIATKKSFGIEYSIDSNEFDITENMTYLDLPLFARFASLPIKGFRFFGDIGVYTGRMINSSSDFSRHSIKTNETFSADRLDSKNRRGSWEYGSIFGLGVMRKLGAINVALDVKYYVAAFTNITDEDKRYQSDNLYYAYYFLDDDIRVNNLAVSLSLFYNLNYRVIKGK